MSVPDFPSDDSPPASSAAQCLARIRGVLTRSHGQALQAVNVAMVEAYWQIGREIVEEEQRVADRAAYGSHLIEELAIALTTEFGPGYGERSLRFMREFYRAFPIRNAVRSELSWTHYRLLSRVADPEARAFYVQECAHSRWSTREPERQIASLLYERLALSTDKVGVRTLAERGHVPDLPEDLVKDPYVLEFVGLPQTVRYTESDLEQALIEHLQTFLLELGRDFFLCRPSEMTDDRRRPFLYRSCLLSPQPALLRPRRSQGWETHPSGHRPDAALHGLLRGRRNAGGRKSSCRPDSLHG